MLLKFFAVQRASLQLETPNYAKFLISNFVALVLIIEYLIHLTALAMNLIYLKTIK